MDAITEGVGNGVQNAATAALTTGLTAVADQLHVAIKAMAVTLAGWILLPSTSVCDTTLPGWINTCNSQTTPAGMVRSWMLPITVLVTVLGVMWQAILMVISRKGEPLLVIARTLGAIVLWGAVGLVGTQLALRAGDAYATWILQQAILGDSLNPTQDLGDAIAGMAADSSLLGAVAMLILQVPFLLATLAQVVLMVFREGAVVILAGQLQLAAAGGLSRLTSGWLARVTGWMLALLAYKPAAASIYAVAFALLGGSVRDIIMGLAVMVMAVIALPALLRLFTWTVGSMNAHSGGLGLLASATAAGLHGAATIRGLGGYGPGEHARYLDSNGPGNSNGGSGGGGGSGPTGGILPPPPGLSHAAPAAPGTGTAGSSGAGPTGAASSGTAAGAGAAAAAGGAAAGVIAVQHKLDEARAQVHRSAGAAGDAMAGG